MVVRRIRMDALEMEIDETPLDTNWRQCIPFLLYPKEKGTWRQLLLHT
jgi:hypothetical protein